MNYNKMGDKFWYDDITVIIKRDKLLNFIPNKNNTVKENLNASVRFIIYISLLLVWYTKNYNYIILIILAFIVTFIINNELYNKIIENYDSSNLIEPSANNPVANILQSDYKNVDRKISNLLKDTDLQNKVKKSLDHKLYRDESDIFDNLHSQRTFYTMPITTIPNKQKDFANFLYNRPSTCKEGNGEQCMNNIFIPLSQGRLDSSKKIINK